MGDGVAGAAGFDADTDFGGGGGVGAGVGVDFAAGDKAREGEGILVEHVLMRPIRRDGAGPDVER